MCFLKTKYTLDNLSEYDYSTKFFFIQKNGQKYFLLLWRFLCLNPAREIFETVLQHHGKEGILDLFFKF